MTTHRDKGELVSDIWGELVRAVNDRHHAWRTPTLATVDEQGFPHARSVVLRSVNRHSNELRIFTDARTPKCQHLGQQPRAMLQFWSKRLNWQLRIAVETQVITEGELVDQAWQRLYQSKAATDYLASTAPGSRQDNIKQSLVAEKITAESQHHLAIIVAKVVEMDWLELNRAGHVRARLTQNSLQWLVP